MKMNKQIDSTLIGIAGLLCLLLLISNNVVNAQASCSCTCCLGNFCSPTFVGTYSVSNCSSCSNVGCTSQFSSCPSSTQSGSNSAVCGTAPAPSPSPPSGTSYSWTGVYQVTNGQCDINQCCCFTGNVIVQAIDSTSVNLLGDITGQCGGYTAASATIYSIPPGNLISNVEISGNNYNIYRSGRTITIQNLSASQCSGSAVCTSGACMNNSGTTTRGFHLQSALVLLFTVLLFSFVINV